MAIVDRDEHFKSPIRSTFIFFLSSPLLSTVKEEKIALCYEKSRGTEFIGFGKYPVLLRTETWQAQVGSDAAATRASPELCFILAHYPAPHNTI